MVDHFIDAQFAFSGIIVCSKHVARARHLELEAPTPRAAPGDRFSGGRGDLVDANHAGFTLGRADGPECRQRIFSQNYERWPAALLALSISAGGPTLSRNRCNQIPDR